MKLTQLFYVLLIVLGSTLKSDAQCVGPHPSSHLSDQIVQGPCYIFATVAAIEAISGQGMDLSEWYFYSRCVLNGASSSGTHMIDHTVAHFNDVGALFQEDFYAPDAPCPYSSSVNPFGGGTPCIFICENTISTFCEEESDQGCPLGMLEVYNGEGDADCEYVDKSFGIHVPSKFAAGSLSQTDLHIEDKDPSERLGLIENELCNGNGVVLFVDDYSPNSDPIVPQHAIYVYDKIGTSLRYKDSWPGNPSTNRLKTIAPSTFAKAYVVEGSVSEVYCGTAPPECECELLTGPECIEGEATYSLIGNCNGAKVWNIPDGLDVVSGGTQFDTSVTVIHTACETDTLYISVLVANCNLFKKEVIAKPNLPRTPTSISLISDRVCPGEIVKFLVEDLNPPYPSTTYEWKVLSGGVIQSGQGTNVICIQTSNFSNGFLKIRVRAVNDCGVSEYAFIGVPFDTDCGGKDDHQQLAIRESETVASIEVYPNPVNDILYIESDLDHIGLQVYSIQGKLILESNSNARQLNVAKLAEGIYILKVQSKDQESEIIRFIKN